MAFSSSKPRRSGLISLLSVAAIALFFAPAVYADVAGEDAHLAHARQHGRMIRKRAPQLGGGLGNIGNVGGDPSTSSGTSVALTTSSVLSTSTTSSAVIVATTSSTTSTTSTSALPSTTSTVSTTALAQNTTLSSTISVANTTSILSTTSTTPSSTVPIPTTTPGSEVFTTSTFIISASHSTSASDNTPTSSPDAAAAATGIAVARKTIVALVAIAGSIGVAFLIWTGIRKWKFRPSRQFEDRMNDPINWQPNAVGYDSTDPASRIAAHRRNDSGGSHASFGSSEMQHTNQGQGASYGAGAGVTRSLSGRTMHSDYQTSTAPPPLPSHDFTVGAAGSDAYDYYHGQHGSPPQMVENGLTRGGATGARPVSVMSEDPYGGFEDEHESNALPPHHGGAYAPTQPPSYRTGY